MHRSHATQRLKPLQSSVSGWNRFHATYIAVDIPLPCWGSGWHRSHATQRLKPLHAAACHRFHALFPQRHIIFSSRIQQRIIFILNKCRSSITSGRSLSQAARDDDESSPPHRHSQATAEPAHRNFASQSWSWGCMLKRTLPNISCTCKIVPSHSFTLPVMLWLLHFKRPLSKTHSHFTSTNLSSSRGRDSLHARTSISTKSIWIVHSWKTTNLAWSAKAAHRPGRLTCWKRLFQQK